jgi:HD-GYP domain-containing protein (c-di-GMP phosphodiesterase class II)
MLQGVKSLRSALNCVLHHHERWDGAGYPYGLGGEAIPLEARILAVADAYDAMTSERPYRAPRTREEALAEVERCAGSQFDPQIARVFVTLA